MMVSDPALSQHAMTQAAVTLSSRVWALALAALICLGGALLVPDPLGALLVTLLAGRPPLDAGAMTQVEVIDAIRRWINEGLPYELAGLVSCLDWPEIMLIRGIVAVAGERVLDAAGSERGAPGHCSRV